jgi:hypothetical protein
MLMMIFLNSLLPFLNLRRTGTTYWDDCVWTKRPEREGSTASNKLSGVYKIIAEF